MQINARVRVCKDLVNYDGGTVGTVVDITEDQVYGNQIRVCWDNMAKWPDGRPRTYTYAEHLLVELPSQN